MEQMYERAPLSWLFLWIACPPFPGTETPLGHNPIPASFPEPWALRDEQLDSPGDALPPPPLPLGACLGLKGVGAPS